MYIGMTLRKLCITSNRRFFLIAQIAMVNPTDNRSSPKNASEENAPKPESMIEPPSESSA